MASIHREIRIEESPEKVWDALRDVGAIHQRLAPGFVTDVKLEPGARIVTFGNGMVVRERIVAVDEQARRVAWSATGDRLSHHNASAQVFPAAPAALDGPGASRFVWIADLLPDEMAPLVTAMIDEGLEAIRCTLERRERGELTSPA